MNRSILLIVSAFMLILLGCSKTAEENTDKTVPVKIYKVKSETIAKYIRVTSSITADEDVVVYAKVSERALKINVRPGQSVMKNMILVEQKNEMQKQGLEMANSALKAAESSAKMAAQDFKRISRLFSEKAVSRQQFDQAQTAMETTEHGYNQAGSAFKQAKEQFENSFVKAPFDGVVAAVYVEENQMINMGQPVVQMISSSRMKSKIKLTGKDIQKVKVGQRVIVRFPILPEEEFEGRIAKINSSIDLMSKSLEAEVVLLKNDPRLKSGMFGEFLIQTQNRANSMVVPEDALLPQTEVRINKETGLQSQVKRFFIFVIDRGRAKLKEVKTGITSDGQVEINNGLNRGDSIIVVGQNIVKEGQRVNIIE